MAILTSGNTLSLNGLAGATGQTTKSISATAGTTSGPISLSQFAIDTVAGIFGYTYAVENTSETYNLGFSGEGTRFNRISERAANFTWSVPVGSKISLSTNNGASAVFAVGDMTIGDPTQTTLQSIISHTIRVKFADGFNHHAVGYNTNKDKTVYSVDSYDGNSTALCLTIDSPVTLADGTVIEAGELSEGDKLKGFSIGGLGTDSDSNFLDWSSPELSKTEKDVTIVNLTYSFSPRYYDINNGEVTATSEHPMLVKDSVSGDYLFKEMFNIVVGDKLIKGDGAEVLVTSINVVETITEIVSIDVEDEDTYMVNGYITHNKGGNLHSDFDGPTAPTTFSLSDVGSGYSNGFTWSGGVADTNSVAGITSYDFQLATDTSFNNLVINEVEWSTNEIQIFDEKYPLVVTPGIYYARVRNIQSGLKSPWVLRAVSFQN